MDEICTACKKRPRKRGFKRCEKCLKYFRKYNAKKKNEGKCTSCGGERDSAKKTCSECLNKKEIKYKVEDKQKRKKIKEERKENNICIECGKNAQIRDTYYCASCLKGHKKKRKEKRKIWRNKGLCTNCGNTREDPSLLRCNNCNFHRRRSVLRRKVEVLTSYGYHCFCCDINQLEFLTIDHINGGGTEHRKQITSLYGWLKKNKYPVGFRVSCINCNTGCSRNSKRGTNGFCPHNDECITRVGKCKVAPYTRNILLSGRSNSKSELKTRLKVINAYGGVCQCCSESQYEFLSIDHVDGGGRKHIKSIKENIYRWARNNGYPKSLRILCLSCNQGREINGGECPHKCKLVSYEGLSLTQATYESLIWNT